MWGMIDGEEVEGRGFWWIVGAKVFVSLQHL